MTRILLIAFLVLGIGAWSARPGALQTSYRGGSAHASAAVTGLIMVSLQPAPMSAPGAVPPLPSSVMPHNDHGCSVYTNGEWSNVCSVLQSQGARRCSAYCDGGDRCSSFATAGPGSTGLCSTHDIPNTQCSVLPGGPPGPPNGSTCSAWQSAPYEYPRCSVFGGWALTGNQFCSAEAAGPPQRMNRCSVFGASSSPGFAVCSMRVSFTNTNRCSTRAVIFKGKRCSVFAPSEEFCSVGPYPGTCTALDGSVPWTCSVHGGTGSCSTFDPGGPGTSGSFCQLP